jgi:hypothetical protein
MRLDMGYAFPRGKDPNSMTRNSSVSGMPCSSSSRTVQGIGYSSLNDTRPEQDKTVVHCHCRSLAKLPKSPLSASSAVKFLKTFLGSLRGRYAELRGVGRDAVGVEKRISPLRCSQSVSSFGRNDVFFCWPKEQLAADGRRLRDGVMAELSAAIYSSHKCVYARIVR